MVQTNAWPLDENQRGFPQTETWHRLSPRNDVTQFPQRAPHKQPDLGLRFWMSIRRARVIGHRSAHKAWREGLRDYDNPALYLDPPWTALVAEPRNRWRIVQRALRRGQRTVSSMLRMPHRPTHRSPPRDNAGATRDTAATIGLITRPAKTLRAGW